MNFELLDDESYKILLSIFMCNLEVNIKSDLFQSSDFLKPYSDGGESIAIGFGLDLKKNSLGTIYKLYQNIFGNDWQISDEEKDILTKLQSNEINTSQAIQKFNALKKLTLDLKTQDNAYKLYYTVLKTYEDKVDKKLSNSYERMALVSRAYNHYGKLIQGAVKRQNRFLIWFYLRYTANTANGKELLGLTKRRWWESEIFKLSDNRNIFESNSEIFKSLNIIQFNKQTLYQYIQEYEQRNLTQKNIDFFKKDAQNREFDKHFTFKYDNITQILSPYLTYINTNFAKGSVSEYALENIYVLNEVKDTEQLNIALNQRKDTKSLTPLLIICLKPKTQAENTDAYTIKQSQNTFLSIVVFEGAKLDISKLNSDESEIIYARDDQEKIEAFLLQGSCQSMQHRNNTLTIQGNSNETYLFDKQPQADNAISPILKVYKGANEKGYIEIHNFAKETLADSTTYILGNDSRQRYSGITLFLNENTKPHNTDCSNEGNFKVIVQNLHLYGLKENEKLFLYNCENRKELLSTITSDYTALFYPVLDLPKQGEHSQRTQSSHIVLSTKEMAENANIQHQTTTANPNFQINRQAKLSQRYIITDAKLSTKKPPLQNKSKVLVQSVSFKDKKYIHYKANDTLTFQAHYNNTKLSQEELKEAKANTKWAYILSTDETLLQKLDYRKITQEGSDSPYIGEDYTLTLKKEYFDINKATYLHIFAYINAPSSKVKQVLKLEYPLSLRFNGKELHIVEWGKVAHSFVAQSGISHHTNTAHTQQANENQIEEKTYYINVNDREESNLAEQVLVFIKNTIQKNTQQEDKGTQFFRLYESKDALYPLNQSNTTAYTLHTGNEYGDYKGIDLAKDKDNELTQNRKDSTNQSHTQSSQGFFHTLESLKQKYKDILESLKDDRGRIMIKVEVGYSKGEMVLEIVRKWEYKTRQSNGSYTYEINKPTISEFKLKKDTTDILQGYMLERTGPDTIESGKNRRIPIGEYNVMWYKSFNKDDSKGGWYGRTIYYENDKEFAKIAIKCEDSRCVVKEEHSHIVPLIYNEKVSKNRYILIHIGKKFDDSNGCLLVGSKLNNSINPTEFVSRDTRPSTRELIKQMILHDKKAYQNFSFINERYQRVERGEISNFKLIIKEDYNDTP